MLSSDFCAFISRLSRVHQDFVRSPEFLAFKSRLSCVLQTFVCWTDFCAFIFRLARVQVQTLMWSYPNFDAFKVRQTAITHNLKTEIYHFYTFCMYILKIFNSLVKFWKTLPKLKKTIANYFFLLNIIYSGFNGSNVLFFNFSFFLIQEVNILNTVKKLRAILSHLTVKYFLTQFSFGFSIKVCHLSGYFGLTVLIHVIDICFFFKKKLRK